MQLIAYYEGDNSLINWLNSMLDRDDIIYRKLPTSNNSSEFTKLPAYVADILNLDKPDLILSGSVDGDHEKPIFSIEFASCTPQYQHALQRFSRMMASVTNGCPSVIIMAKKKRENDKGIRVYARSKALEYGAVKLMDIYDTPAFVFDWSDKNGTLEMEPSMQLPRLDSDSMLQLKNLLIESIAQFHKIDYIAALWRLPIVKNLLDRTRERAYLDGAPSIARPGGGTGSNSLSKLKLLDTLALVDDIENLSPVHKKQVRMISDFITGRPKSLVFYPTRVTAHAGDPYVGMIGYYDIAFCRVGKSTRERNYNLIAFCENVSISEVETVMEAFNRECCPFTQKVEDNFEQYAFHLRYGCRQTKNKPIRIYSELADLIIFKDGIIYNVG